MLQKINERIQGLLAWIIILLITITFTLFGVDYYLQSKHDRNVQASVNDQIIDTHNFQLSYRRALRSRSSSNMTLEEEQNIKKNVLDDLIVNAVSFNAAKNNGFYIGTRQANSAILQIPQFQYEGHFSSDRYVHALNNALFTPQSFETEVQQGMLLNQQKFAWVGTDFVLPSELNKFLVLYNQKRAYSYLKLPVNSFMQQVIVNDNEVETYYKKHSKQFLNPETISIDYIELSKSSLRNLIKVSDDEINQYYEENFKSSTPETEVKSLDEVKSSIREQLLIEKIDLEYSRLLEQLTDLSYQESESLTSVAEEMHLPLAHSELFSVKGGDTDITRNPAIIKVAFSHDVLKFGNNSSPININDNSAIVLRVNKHNPVGEKTLADVKDIIITKLKRKKAEQALKVFAKKITNNQISDNELQKDGLSWVRVSDITRDSEKPSELMNELIFNMSKINSRSTHKLSKSEYVILQLNSIIPGNLKKIDQELKSSISQQMEASFGLLDYDLYIHNLMSLAKIVKY